MKKGRIEIDSDKILIKTAFIKQTIKLSDIKSVEYPFNIHTYRDINGDLYTNIPKQGYIPASAGLSKVSLNKSEGMALNIEIRFTEDNNYSVFKYIYKKLSFNYGFVKIRSYSFSDIDPYALYITLKTLVKKQPKMH